MAAGDHELKVRLIYKIVSETSANMTGYKVRMLSMHTLHVDPAQNCTPTPRSHTVGSRRAARHQHTGQLCCLEIETRA